MAPMEDQFRALLTRLVDTPSADFAESLPFPYITVDGSFDPKTVEEIHGLFYSLPDSYWQKNNDHGIEVKWRSDWKSEYDIPEPAREIVRFFNSGPFLRALSSLTGISNLIPDPYYTGGGFNLIRNGGHLDVHVDGNWHDMMQVHRRLNLILYLNQGWRADWRGALNFYDQTAQHVVTSVQPIGNRLVIFETTDFSYHGHPEPVQCPEEEGRSSIILYYYTSSPRPTHQIAESKPHSALWRSKEWTDKKGNRSRN